MSQRVLYYCYWTLKEISSIDSYILKSGSSRRYHQLPLKSTTSIGLRKNAGLLALLVAGLLGLNIRWNGHQPLPKPNQTTTTTTTTKTTHHVIPPKAFHVDDYNFCTITSPEPQLGQPMVSVKEMGDRISPAYQCNGQPYRDFMEVVHSFLEQRYREDPTEQWGRRPFPVPPQHNRNRTSSTTTTNSKKKKKNKKKKPKQTRILIMGNSHTRQVMSSLLCQYKHLIVNATRIAAVPGSARDNEASQFELKGGLTLFVITNHPFVYSKRWALSLSLDILGFSLQSLDAIVLGSFNRLAESVQSNFMKLTLEYQKQRPRHKVEFQFQPPPLLDDVAATFAGPIVWMSMFSLYNAEYHLQALTMMEDLRNRPPASSTTNNTTTKQPTTALATHHHYQRTNLRAVYGRHYIHPELDGAECSSDQYSTVATCLPPHDSRYSQGHRCVGPIGGFPDLIAWDLIEALWGVLSS